MESLKNIRTANEIDCMRDEAMEILNNACNGFDTYEDMEDMMMGYGLEMDYIMDLF